MQERTRIEEFRDQQHTMRVTESQILIGILDLTTAELLEETKRWLDPYKEAGELYETETFQEFQRSLVEDFLRKAIADPNARQRAIELGREMGFWDDE
jgi:hypothetical protein